MQAVCNWLQWEPIVWCVLLPGYLVTCKCLRKQQSKGAEYDATTSGGGDLQDRGPLASAATTELPNQQQHGKLHDVVQSLVPAKSRVTPAHEAADELSPTARDVHSRGRARGNVTALKVPR